MIDDDGFQIVTRKKGRPSARPSTKNKEKSALRKDGDNEEFFDENRCRNDIDECV